MENRVNDLDQPIGFAVPGWQPPPRPPREAMDGRFCRLEPLDPARHATELFAANALDADARGWTYLPYGPFERFETTATGCARPASATIHSSSPSSIRRRAGRSAWRATCASIRATARSRSATCGSPPLLQRTPAATEAMYLMMQRAFGLGYRRYEWKCDALNAPSRAAALRLGLSFEGVFRQATVYKGRNRDTAWFAATDSDWPALERAFQRWLDPANFDAQGRQRTRLSVLTAPLLSRTAEGSWQ